jgi:hypothetical protein
VTASCCLVSPNPSLQPDSPSLPCLPKHPLIQNRPRAELYPICYVVTDPNTRNSPVAARV